ncbi:neuroglobin-1-like isoform X2 [Gigantopelta aegis]|uniref:neuroglobin-1-like isoform X2 n=1 Tax=Gigantopelta aegis TaxID=1735272 RepID=UPI001B887EE3|nr:neuroglobin-1-like isoform X2 [Gigantopelta aegis]
MGVCGSSANKFAFTEEDKKYIRISWDQFSQGDMAENGKLVFTRMFEKSPAIQDLFYYSTSCKVMSKKFGKNCQFDNHICQVFDTLGSIVSILDDCKKLETSLEDVGSAHAMFAFEKDYFNVFGECLLVCLEQKLGDSFTPQVKTAWTHFSSFILEFVLAGWTVRMDKLNVYR